ncbi:MAG: hypothetical protein HY744_04645 [Deltaproteobacteria bacterium]|nr:hypothetical protein [Deltaproteobacteria bacterium]
MRAFVLRPAFLLGGLLVSVLLALACSGGEGAVVSPAGTQGTGGGGPTCPGQELCGSACADTRLDPANCGGCGKACPPGQVCSAGQCGGQCSGGTIDCGGRCVDPESDPSHCGACGNARAGALVCSAGACALACVGGSTKCGKACVNVDNDPAHCGNCDAPCGAGEVCSGGQCALDCVGGSTKCAGKCVDTALNPEHCGACNNACGAGEVCSAGQCALQCLGGTTKCGNKCVDTEANPAHCGGCRKACPPGQVCSAEKCSLECAGGATKCGNGCVDVKIDPANCGSCGNVCPQGQVCSAGACALECTGGTTKCGSSCVDTKTDPAHCGGCNSACQPQQVCAGGVCIGTVCTPNVAELCYSGPGDSLGKGKCKPGTKTCKQDGTGYGACSGEVLPDQKEACGNKIDDNCDGAVDENCILTSCKAIKAADPKAASGKCTIDPDGNGPLGQLEVQCQMTRDGGGWTLGIKSWYQGGVAGNVGAVGNIADALNLKGNPYKLDDEVIRAIIGKSQHFDVLADQNGYNSSSSNGNYEYVVLRNYTAFFRFDAPVAASLTQTQLQSYRAQDDALAWTGNLQCGIGGWGINCNAVLQNNPQGGAGCLINMGNYSNSGYHHFYMSESNTDTYLYICNGPQHSSGYNMNHRWWFREY